MTPEQLQQYVEAALKQRDQFNLVFYPLTIVLSIGGAWLISYVRAKGKNLATKEDISEITRKVESIKTDLATKQHFNQIRYEREMKVFEEIWPKLCELQEAVLALRPVMDTSPQEGETKESRKLKRAENFTAAFVNFRTAIKHSRPFYPPVIWDELGIVLKLCWGEATEFGIFSDERKPRDYWEKAMNNAKVVNEQIDKTCEAIRTRLSKFDSN
ncbi:MAG TPA: hypothetical protein VK815_06855 [Candidatus Acidoferrales bacterium]|jgi:hypothetical protein|nr:hypothetical protein [Candidatus Acidoferrales bacterium]